MIESKREQERKYLESLDKRLKMVSKKQYLYLKIEKNDATLPVCLKLIFTFERLYFFPNLNK